MKTCEYCGKEIDYNHAFCDDECEQNTFNYYKNRKRWQGLFSGGNISGIVACLIGLVVGVISKNIKIGLLITGSGILVIGILYLVLPYYGLDEQIKNKGIISTTKTVRMLGVVAMLIGVVCVICGIIVPLK
ncbi:MAG: DUF2116 family Zn-ribbon domain-containing protein [Clostridia bacterium]|nr:DUF2116 family Zn-ribbon domain-containing protein [Clostridia bacterium]